MPYIVRYQKVTDAYTTHRLAEPVDAEGDSLATELCELDGDTYVAIAGEVSLPDQPPIISVEVVEMYDALRERIKLASPHARLVQERMQAQIRDRYSLEDELYLARISVGALRGSYEPDAEEQALLDDYQAWVEGIRDWGRAERAKLGL